ncbi:phosphotransferase [Pseudomonas sp. NPDC077382]
MGINLFLCVDTVNTSSPMPARLAFWLRPGSLEERLHYLIPSLPPKLDDLTITSDDLRANAPFVNHVHRHRIVDAGGTVHDLVEKSIRKSLGIRSLEARFYHERKVLDGSRQFHHPRLYGIIETPRETLIYTGYVEGKRPDMAASASRIGCGIAELENRSTPYLRAASPVARIGHWQMDFFRPWYLLRPRYNFQRLLPQLAEQARTHAPLAGMAERLGALRPVLNREARRVRISPQCFSHLDYVKKNLFLTDKGLHLIDWSEVKIGRVGFDGGVYLSRLFRRMDVPRFVKVRAEFTEAYLAALDPAYDRLTVLCNLEFSFVLQALWLCLRPETLEAYLSKGRLNALLEKYEYLLARYES